MNTENNVIDMLSSNDPLKQEMGQMMLCLQWQKEIKGHLDRLNTDMKEKKVSEKFRKAFFVDLSDIAKKYI